MEHGLLLRRVDRLVGVLAAQARDIVPLDRGLRRRVLCGGAVDPLADHPAQPQAEARAARRAQLDSGGRGGVGEVEE